MVPARRTNGTRRPKRTATERAWYAEHFPRSRPGHRVIGGSFFEGFVAQVLSAVLSGVSIGDIERLYGLSPTTTKRWLSGWGISGVKRRRTRTIYYQGLGPEPATSEYLVLWPGK